MIKIVRIIARLNIGGPAINAILLTEGFNNNDFKTLLIAGHPEVSEGDMSYIALEKGIEPVIMNELARSVNPVKDIKALWKIYRIIKKEQPDIVHTHTAKAGALGRIAAILAGVPVKVHTFHGHVFDKYFNNLTTNIFIAVERILARFTTKIIAVSNSVAKDISARYNITTENKIAVIPLGFELERFFQADKNKGKLRQELGLSSDVFLVGIVGRLVPIKNHRMFLDAAKIIYEVGAGFKPAPIGYFCQKAKFIIVGDGQLRQELENYAAELDIKDRVMFLGWRKDLENIYADLNIVCLTSLNEGTPVSLIEAMASGKPVVATDVGGVKDIVKDRVSGILVNTNDVSGFSEAVAELLKNSAKRVSMGEHGREFVAQNFKKERLIKDMESLYKDLLKQRGLL